MYKNRKFNKGAKPAKDTKASGSMENKRPLGSIDENASVKFARTSLNVASVQKKTRPTSTTAVVADVCTLEEGGGSSEENIPASQEATQRYLSQRSMIASSLGRTQSRNLSGRPPKSYFELVLIKAGVLLDEANNFVLSCDHISFVNKFREVFLKCSNYNENADMFKSGLSEALSPKCKYSLKLLSGCTISIPGHDSVYQSQESMIVNFLMIDFLRDAVVDILLNKTSEAAKQRQPVFLANGTVPFLPLLIAQLRHVTQSHSTLIYERITGIFNEASEVSKQDIIMHAGFILEASKHDGFVQMLLDKLPLNKDLFNVSSIQSLANLNLGKSMQEQLRHRILDYIKEEGFVNTALPLLVNLLLKYLAEASDEEVTELVTTIRQILVWRLNTPMERTTQLELFNFIEQAFVRSKKFYTMWQKLLSLVPGSQFKSLDFIMVLLLIHVKEDNYMYIENVLRRRIKLEHITVDIFIEMKSDYAAVLEQHTAILMQLMYDFLREKNKIVAEFAKASYGILFQICDSIQRTILRRLLQLTCDKSTQNLTNLALKLLRELQRKYRPEIQNWGTLLMPLLDRLSELTLSQTRLAMELLCSIAFPPPPLSECTVLQDQLDMLLKKQIINHSVHVKKQGIIGSVQLIDCMARIEDTIIEHDDFNTSYSNASSLPDGRGKMAANFIMLVESSAIHCPESLALFYDEMACSCRSMPSERDTCTQLDKPYLIWLCDVMTFYFQNSFVAEHSPTNTFGINLTYQKCINTVEDTENMEESEVPSIAINIAELVLKPGTVSSSSILILAPLFNLVRSLHLQRYQGSLEQINALLGCAIILPSFFDESNTDAIFYDYDEQLQKRILDIYFHCVNWMRETVSSFSTQQESMIRNKVLQRLNELIATEEKVRLLLDKAPADYVPPQAQFITSNTAFSSENSQARSKPTASTKATQQKDPNDKDLNSESIVFNDTHVGNVTNEANATFKLANIGRFKNTDNKKRFDVLYRPREVYRQMDSDIMLILREELVVKYPLPLQDIGKRIGLLELRFILNDLVCKLESITGAQKLQNEQPSQHIAKPEYFMYDLSKFLQTIVERMSRLSTEIIKQLESVKYVYSNGDLFTTEFNYIKLCFNMCVRLLAVFFSWTQFSDGNATEALLKDSLLVLLANTQRQSLCKKSLADVAAAAFNVMLKYEVSVTDLKTAVHLQDLLKILKRFSSKTESSKTNELEQRKALIEKQEKDIRGLCKKFLQRKWFSYEGLAEKGGTCNIYLDILVKGFLKNSDFRRLGTVLRALIDECKQLKGNDSALKSFPNFKKANFPILFRAMCESTVGYLCELINKTATQRDDKMKMWDKSCELFNILLDIVKALDVPRNFQLFTKYSHQFLKLLLQHGLEAINQTLRDDPGRVSEFLKSLQTVTRFLHNICCHSKALRNTAIIGQIPALRETVETLVFRVKALMTANKCSSVFTMGNLKNKDIHGDEILSQSSRINDASEHDSEEDIPDDDDSVDETLTGDDGSAGRRESAEEPTNTYNRSKSSSRSKCF
ncbi:PREDICTED: Fanconi anemia group D2 protein isoform X2 [Rhagoletis zephyria]|uniref:Fanconi anemia group D2 protein isoform X1 n=1 Tax=Rhagoletis zephyria TaxID=28612 RepID=UPI0008112D5D|nr:PREDICTED: Fanconi anemia group D2 protein isoform X1 [Rhagoletis zephyria]XP_017471045.1 PREDICTED: Fanconi anemia group D2 protein isoform X2 [Rhagoletis zephyria]